MPQTYTATSISPELTDRLRAMPKAEIHVHVEGATDAETFYQMAQRNQVELPTDSLEMWKSFFEFRDFPHFIQVYAAAVKCLRTPEDYALMIERLYKRQSEENILYTEAFLSASFMHNMSSSHDGGFDVVYRVSPPVSNDELNKLFAATWQGHTFTDFPSILERSLTFVCAYHLVYLVGFVNLAWDGGVHAFILDTTVHPRYQGRGIGQQLVRQAVAVAKERDIEWVHVDFEPHLQTFYDKCGFKNTKAGLLNLKQL